ncbi:MAG: hypothetical protein KDE35_03790 [Geminicoccaceae bacterium]|nr:hypothetical protein [Geminicoccaceae bacterium]
MASKSEMNVVVGRGRSGETAPTAETDWQSNWSKMMTDVMFPNMTVFSDVSAHPGTVGLWPWWGMRH